MSANIEALVDALIHASGTPGVEAAKAALLAAYPMGAMYGWGIVDKANNTTNRSTPDRMIVETLAHAWNAEGGDAMCPYRVVRLIAVEGEG